MKKGISVLMAFMLMIIMCVSCKVGLSHDAYKEIYERYSNIKSYRAEAEVTVVSNKTENKYKLKQYYMADNLYRADMTAPKELEGIRYIFNNGELKISSSSFKDIEFKDYVTEDKDFLFINDFFDGYYKSEDTLVEANRNVSGTQTVLTNMVTGNNPYRFCQKLWIDNKTFLPIKMITYDVNNNPVLIEMFTDFVLNSEEINENLFTIRR